MPWLSKAQARWGHTPAGRRALGGKDAVAEWDADTEPGSLPERKKGKLRRAAERHSAEHDMATGKIKDVY